MCAKLYMCKVICNVVICKCLARASTCKIIYIWIPLLTTITRNIENKYETPKSCRFRRRRCSMISFCTALRMLHIDKSALQSCRRRNRFSQSSCGPRCRANANISRDPEESKHRGRVPEVANSLAYTWIPLSVSAARLSTAAPSFPLLCISSSGTDFIPGDSHGRVRQQ